MTVSDSSQTQIDPGSISVAASDEMSDEAFGADFDESEMDETEAEEGGLESASVAGGVPELAAVDVRNWVEPTEPQVDSRKKSAAPVEEVEDDLDLDTVDDILALPEGQFPKFTLAKNKARFLRMVSFYRQKQEWLEVGPLSQVTKLFKQQTKELVDIRASKLDYEMELEMGTLTPSQRSYRRDELKMCRVHEKMAVNLISKMQVKIKSGRR